MLDKQKKLWYDVGVKCAGVVTQNPRLKYTLLMAPKTELLY